MLCQLPFNAKDEAFPLPFGAPLLKTRRFICTCFWAAVVWCSAIIVISEVGKMLTAESPSNLRFRPFRSQGAPHIIQFSYGNGRRHASQGAQTHFRFLLGETL